MLPHVRLFSLFFSFAIFSLSFGVAIDSTFAQSARDCSLVSGVSTPASYNSGAVDFEYADYLLSLFEDQFTDGTPIDEDYRVCIDENGQMGTTDTDNGYAWNTNLGWFDFAWCLTSCEGEGQPKVNLDPADEWYGYWSGYAWNEDIGYIWFDWTCYNNDECDTTRRVHTDLSTGELSGYAWNEPVGWINFGGASYVLPSSSLTARMELSMTPDPLTVSKAEAPLADGGGAYTLKVKIFMTDGGYYLGPDPDGDLTPDYALFVAPNFDPSLNLCFSETQMTSCGPQAAILGDISYDTTEQAWIIPIMSYAPTTNANGYDADGDGLIDYYFDLDPNDATGIARANPNDLSTFANRLAIESVDLTLNLLTDSAIPIEWDSSDPLYQLNYNLDSGEAYDLKFAPAIEVANLERVDGSVLVPYLVSTQDIEQFFQGLVVNWSNTNAFNDLPFNVKSILNVETDVPATDPLSSERFEFLFDTDPPNLAGPASSGDGSYTHFSEAPPGTTPDSNMLVSTFTLVAPGDASYLSTFDAGTDRAVHVSDGDRFASLGGGSYGTIPEAGMIVPGSNMIDTEPSGPRYETRVFYDIVLASTKEDVRISYYSNYLPQSGSTNDPEDVTISGGITSVADEQIDIETLSGEEVVVLGDIYTLGLRNELYKRFSELTKGVTPLSYAAEAKVSGALALDTSDGGVELNNDTLIYLKDMDVRLTGVASSYDSKTIVVWGGDIFIDSDLLADSTVGLVAFKNTDGEGGHVYIESSVTDLKNVNIFAEGSLFSYKAGYTTFDTTSGVPQWANATDRASGLPHQLYLKGNVVSKNTIYGADSDLGLDFDADGISDYVLWDGTTTEDLALAKEYDFNRLREFSLCWIQVDILGNPVDYDGDGSTSDADGNPDAGDVEPCAGAQRSGNIDTSDNTPVYFEYSPPPSGLPILGESQSGKINVF